MNDFNNEIIFEKINNDPRIDKEYLSKYFFFTCIDIDNYEASDVYEVIRFSLDFTTTGNVFYYMHNLLNNTYFSYKTPCLYTLKTPTYEIPDNIIANIFNVARDYFSEKTNNLTLKK